jgi:hypothetical protein
VGGQRRTERIEKEGVDAKLKGTMGIWDDGEVICNISAHETAMKKVLDQMEKEMQEAKLK